MKVLVENSGLNNIGDGFYQLSLHSLILREFPSWDVYSLESPIYRTFKMTRKWHRKNAFPLMHYQEADLYIFSGPILRQLISNYKIIIHNLMQSGKQYALIGCSCEANLPSTMRKEIGDFLMRYPPAAFSTRDPETFDQLKDYIAKPYSGICPAFLVDIELKIDNPIMDQPYFVSSFYSMFEPNYKSSEEMLTIDSLIIEKRDGFFWRHLARYSQHLAWLARAPDSLCGSKIIRTHHGITYGQPHKHFCTSNSYISHNPITFLSIYKGAQFVVSDRVHACVAGLAFGKPALLLGKNGRTGIFSRVGLNPNAGTPMRLDPAKIRHERANLVAYLKERLYK